MCVVAGRVLVECSSGAGYKQGKTQCGDGPSHAPYAPLMMKSAALRRRGMRDMAWHGDRVGPARALEMTDDGIGCSVTSEVFSTDEEQIASLDRLPCPITIAGAEKDALLPVELYEKVARALLPQATFEILPGVGHLRRQRQMKELTPPTK